MAKPTWLTVNPSTGSGNKTVVNSASEHTGRISRTGTVTVTASGIATPKTYNVIQTAKEEFVSFDEGEETSSPKDGGKFTLTGYSNGVSLKFSWVSNSNSGAKIAETVSINRGNILAGSRGETIQGDPGASYQYPFSIELNIPPNTTVNTVSRVLKVETPNKSAQINIKQSAGDPTLSISPASITISQAGTGVNVTIGSNTSWTIS